MANLSIFDQTKNILPVYWTYCGLGLFALLANFFIVVVYVSTSSLRTKFALFIGLAVAEGINGAAFFINGMERLMTEYSLQDVYTYPKVTRSDCAAQVGNTLLIIGSQGPALISLALGVERFCAIKFPTSYRRFKERMFHALLILTTLICAISACVALYIGLELEKNNTAFFTCSLSNAFGYTYTTFNYLFTSFGHIAGFIFNFIAFWVIQKFKVGARNKTFLKEVDQIRLMHFISICSLIMVVIPNLFIYSARFNFYIVDNMFLGWLNCAFVFRSVFSLYVLGFRSLRFRQRISELTGCCRFKIKPLPSDTGKSASNTAARHYARQVTESPITIF